VLVVTKFDYLATKNKTDKNKHHKTESSELSKFNKPWIWLKIRGEMASTCLTECCSIRVKHFKDNLMRNWLKLFNEYLKNKCILILLYPDSFEYCPPKYLKTEHKTVKCKYAFANTYNKNINITKQKIPIGSSNLFENKPHKVTNL
jgi:hypothetical protein